MIIVSACLAGLNTRYDCKNKADEYIVSLVSSLKAVPLCPEVSGGLSVPRRRSEISCGDGYDVISGEAGVFTDRGEDVTTYFIRGAEALLKLTESMSIEYAILKDGSPSCGVNYIKRNSTRVKGVGVAAALLRMSGIEVICVKRARERFDFQF